MSEYLVQRLAQYLQLFSSSTVVELSAPNPKIDSSNPALG
jgi:hypothetical protein